MTKWVDQRNSPHAYAYPWLPCIAQYKPIENGIKTFSYGSVHTMGVVWLCIFGILIGGEKSPLSERAFSAGSCNSSLNGKGHVIITKEYLYYLRSTVRCTNGNSQAIL